LPLAARAQQGNRMCRIGVLMVTDETDLGVGGFLDAIPPIEVNNAE
jgi:hypothetical protein